MGSSRAGKSAHRGVVTVLVGVLAIGAAVKLMGGREAPPAGPDPAAAAGGPAAPRDQGMRGMAGTIDRESVQEERKDSAAAGAEAGGKPARVVAGAIEIGSAGGEPAADAARAARGAAVASEKPVASPDSPAAPRSPESGLKLDIDFASAKRIIPFAFNRVGVGPAGSLAVRELAPLAKQARKVYVRGRTDSSGDTELNRQVALNRAYTVRTAFVRAGVEESKLRVSYCTTCFIAPNDTVEGRRANRRVDVELLMPAEEIARLPKPVHALEYPSAAERPLALAPALAAPGSERR